MKQDVNRDASGEAFKGGKEEKGDCTFGRSRTLDKEDQKAKTMLRNC